MLSAMLTTSLDPDWVVEEVARSAARLGTWPEELSALLRRALNQVQ